MKKIIIQKKHVVLLGKSFFWFFVGGVLGLFFTISFAFIIFQKLYGETIYPGVYVNGINFGGKTEKQVTDYLNLQNQKIADTTFTFTYNDAIATISAKDINAGYSSSLLAHQAYTIGRSRFILSDIVLVFQAYLSGVFLPASYGYSPDALIKSIQPLIDKAKVDPIDALFNFQNGKVQAFRPSAEGQQVDLQAVQQTVANKIPVLLMIGKKDAFTLPLPITTLKPKITTEGANNLGIKELIGVGTSLFGHSIPSRIYNVNLASSRINGVLVSPGEEFSFDKAVGDVSALTGYQQAYVIVNGKTVLGDGGGLCQVSTTLFRGILNAGLQVTERHAHAYRVGYYEEDSPPGIDATVYVPAVDLKFKNDTGHSILIQEVIDPVALRLTFYLYGTKDGRDVNMTTPVVTNTIPSLPTIYTDDPTLPAGTLKQTDFAAEGATASFHRTVKQTGKTIIDETYTSVYQPWAAAYLRGTGQ